MIRSARLTTSLPVDQAPKLWLGQLETLWKQLQSKASASRFSRRVQIPELYNIAWIHSQYLGSLAVNDIES